MSRFLFSQMQVSQRSCHFWFCFKGGQGAGRCLGVALLTRCLSSQPPRTGGSGSGRSSEVAGKEKGPPHQGLRRWPCVLVSGQAVGPKLLEHAGRAWREAVYFPGLGPFLLRPCSRPQAARFTPTGSRSERVGRPRAVQRLLSWPLSCPQPSWSRVSSRPPWSLTDSERHCIEVTLMGQGCVGPWSVKSRKVEVREIRVRIPTLPFLSRMALGKWNPAASVPPTVKWDSNRTFLIDREDNMISVESI